jgi:hypothetical protein
MKYKDEIEITYNGTVVRIPYEEKHRLRAAFAERTGMVLPAGADIDRMLQEMPMRVQHVPRHQYGLSRTGLRPLADGLRAWSEVVS